jgi:hypothetical protein
MGCVAESLADVAPVQTNDSLAFTALLAWARLTANVRQLSSHLNGSSTLRTRPGLQEWMSTLQSTTSNPLNGCVTK